MQEAIGSAMAASEAMLMGRVLYEEWAAFWPKQDPDENPIAARMNGIRKYVVSTTLEEPLQWQNSTLINENVVEEIEKLKEQPGKEISISGSPTLVRSLLQDDLLDELRLSWSIPSWWGAGSVCLRTGEIRRLCSSWTRRRSARAFSISPTSRRKAEAKGEGWRLYAEPSEQPGDVFSWQAYTMQEGPPRKWPQRGERESQNTEHSL
jgi:dihydrofolate reductase